MCMMGLFVILWVLKQEGAPASGNTSDNQKLVKQVAAIRDAFGYIPDPKSLDPVDVMMMQERLRGDHIPLGPGEGAKTQRENEGRDGPDKQVTKIRDGIASSIGTGLLFDAGTAQLTPAAMQGVHQLIPKIKGYRYIVRIKGHTSLDDLADDATAEQKMDLSLARAKAVADVLVAEGVSPDVLRIEGCSTFEPAKQRKPGPEGQVTNRRVEVEVTDQLVGERQDRGASPPAGR
jgi:outer membrane protein OmpA-like peptidoglycan-associated protein